MKKAKDIKQVNDYNHFIGAAEGHRFVSIIRYEDVSPIPHGRCHFFVYALFLRDDHEEDLDYGMSRYDYHEGSLICVSPGQTGGVEANGKSFHAKGWALLFSPELIAGTPLEKHIAEMSFFAYSQNEALHMSAEERETYISLLKQLRSEAEKPADDVQKAIIINYLELILNFCSRFYNRQFATRRAMAGDVLSRFEHVLRDYYRQEKQHKHGLPTVQYCAQELNLSSNYFSDLMKRETGESPITHIHRFVVEQAKNMLVSGQRPSDVAYLLGFDYPGHFGRLFKRLTGMTPSQYMKDVRE